MINRIFTPPPPEIAIGFLVALVVLRGYAEIYPYALGFVVTRPIIPVSEQGSTATFLTVMFQCLVAYFLFCCLWSFRRLKRGGLNPLFPVLYGAIAFPLLIGVILVVL